MSAQRRNSFLVFLLLMICFAMAFPLQRAAGQQPETQQPAAAQPQAAPAPAQQAPAAAVPPYRPWIGPDGKPLPFKTDDEVLAYLRDAKIIKEHDTNTGVTNPKRLTLEKDGIVAEAIFRAVNEEKTMMQFSGGGTEMNFRDSYLFEPAAYVLARMLRLTNVPPAELRKVKGIDGSIQIWVENAMDEAKRVKSKAVAPDQNRWARQYHTMNIFDQLVDNTDRNRGNILITPDWKMWFIDHTRAFRRTSDLRNPNVIVRCSRMFYDSMKALDEATLKKELKPYLREVEITAIIKRRDKIIKRLDTLAAEKGEAAVFWEGDAAGDQP